MSLHTIIHNAQKQQFPDAPHNGFCWGTSQSFLDTWFDDSFDNFMDCLGILLSQHPEAYPEKINDLLTIINQYQSPSAHQEALGEQLIQHQVEEINQRIAPLHHRVCFATFFAIYNLEDLVNYLTCLNRDFAKHATHKFAMTMNDIGHGFALCYSVETKKWHFLDANMIKYIADIDRLRQGFSLDTPNDILIAAAMIFSAFDDNLTHSIGIISHLWCAKDHKNSMTKTVNALQQTKEFSNTHALTTQSVQKVATNGTTIPKLFLYHAPELLAFINQQPSNINFVCDGQSLLDERGDYLTAAAAASGKLNVLQKLLSFKTVDGKLLVNFKTKDKFGNHFLAYAVSEGQTEIVAYFTQLNQNNLLIDFNQKSHDSGYTVLHLAALFGHSAIVKILLAAKNPSGVLAVTPTLLDNFGNTVAHYAIDNKRESTEILTHLGKFDFASQLFSTKNLMGKLPLHLAIASNNPAALKYLVSHGSFRGSVFEYLTAKDNRKNTALHLAAALDDEQALSILIAAVKNDEELQYILKFKNSLGQTPLATAVAKNQICILKFLHTLAAKKMSDGSPIVNMLQTDKECFQLIHIAACEGSTESLAFLLSLTDENNNPLFNLNTPDSRLKHTPLHLATIGGHVKTVEQLIALGANPLLKSSHGFTALQRAQENEFSPRAKAIATLLSQYEKEYLAPAPQAQISLQPSLNYPLRLFEKATPLTDTHHPAKDKTIAPQLPSAMT